VLTVSGSIEITPVPEPSSLSMLVAGLVAVSLMWTTKHRRRPTVARSSAVPVEPRRLARPRCRRRRHSEGMRRRPGRPPSRAR
jgi:hypothetical protein